MPVNLKINMHDSVEMNFYPSIFKSEIIQENSRTLTVRMINDEVSALLAEGVECIVENGDRPGRTVVIKKAVCENGWRLLTCAAAGKRSHR
jgi:hypothetical protein